MEPIHRREFLKAAAASAAALALKPSGQVEAADVVGKPARPNILVFLTDDHGQWAQGAYGNKEVKTPNMDRTRRADDQRLYAVPGLFAGSGQFLYGADAVTAWHP